MWLEANGFRPSKKAVHADIKRMAIGSRLEMPIALRDGEDWADSGPVLFVMEVSSLKAAEAWVSVLKENGARAWIAEPEAIGEDDIWGVVFRPPSGAGLRPNRLPEPPPRQRRRGPPPPPSSRRSTPERLRSMVRREEADRFDPERTPQGPASPHHFAVNQGDWGEED
jgi:hypothetical protein